MNLIAKRMPGPVDPPAFRLMFSERPGERPIGERTISGTDGLRQFLVEKLEIARPAANRIAAELESRLGTTTFYENLGIDAAEIKALLKQLEREDRGPQVASEKATE